MQEILQLKNDKILALICYLFFIIIIFNIMNNEQILSLMDNFPFENLQYFI